MRASTCSAPELHAFMKRAARGFTRLHAFGEELPNIENRVELASDKDEFGMPLGQHRPQLRPGRRRAVERQLRGRPQDRQGDRRQGGLVGTRRHADHPPHGRHDHGHRRRQLGDQQLRPDPRGAEPVDRGARHLRRPAGASNPTYTIFALSLRGAEQLAANYASVAG